MEVTAVVRVRAEGSGSRPSRERIDTAAQYLRTRGFDVLHTGRFGVTVRAAAETYAQEFKVNVEAGRALVADVTPRAPTLAQVIDGIEIAPPAQSFARSVAG